MLICGSGAPTRGSTIGFYRKVNFMFFTLLVRGNFLNRFGKVAIKLFFGSKIKV